MFQIVPACSSNKSDRIIPQGYMMENSAKTQKILSISSLKTSIQVEYFKGKINNHKLKVKKLILRIYPRQYNLMEGDIIAH